MPFFLFHAARVSLMQVLFISVNEPVKKMKFCLIGWLDNMQKGSAETSQLIVRFNLLIFSAALD